ncbi:MAG: ATP-binding protein [Pseudobdellovibrionaceae bacterium]
MFVRRAQKQIEHALKRGKSVLVLGPRQVGKTTLLEQQKYDLSISLLIEKNRMKYERDPDLLLQEIQAHPKAGKGMRVFLDEVQLVPKLLTTAQYIIDKKLAQMVFTGSSARKIRKHSDLNLLPGRLVLIHLDSLSFTEHGNEKIDEILLYGELPAILTESSKSDKNSDLESYVMTYLEEEIRKEAVTKNLPAFYRFLEMSSLEAGKIVSLRQIGSESGVGHNTIGSYFEILEDSLIVFRVDPFTTSSTRKKLTKSSKYLFFDLGVRRLAAKEGVRLGKNRMGELFEQYVGIELSRLLRFHVERNSLSFWRDPDGPEIDWLIRGQNHLVPIEVKYKEKIDKSDCRHLEVFLREYPEAKKAYVVCLAERPYKITDQIVAIPWQQLEKTIED